MSINTLKELFVAELQDLYSAETQLLEALPKMAQKASHSELKSAFTEHLNQTQEQVARLERVFSGLGASPGGKHCEGMEELIREADEIALETMDPDVRDAALIAAAQRVEHYEIAGYGSARSHAEQLGDRDAAYELQKTLDQEGATDKKLTKLAEGGIFTSGINREARE